MGLVSSCTRRWAWAGSVIAGIALVLIPAVALAANTATFSSRTPASGSSSANASPTISVTVYDKYGVHGSGKTTMKVDGKTVSTTLAYIIKGSFDPAHPDYRRFKLSYRPATALSVGKHTVYVKVKDKKNKISSLTWSFTVKAPEAAYSATFSSATPALDSSSTVSTPTIAVTVYDKYGVKGSGTYSMSIDGTAVTSTIKYTKSGIYTGFKLSYQVSSALSYGTHVVAVSVTDLHKHVTDYSWSFIVLEPIPVYADMPTAGTACTDCHVGYPTAHPMTQCQLCHGEGRPVGAPTYTSADQSAHTLACSLESPCHGGGGSFPHVLSSDCASCHSGRYSDIPTTHSSDVASLHETTATFCTTTRGCHVASLTKEHYRYTIDGSAFTCATCHASTDAKVVAAIASGSTACLSCHDFSTTAHAGTSTAHTASNTCVQTGCHATDVTSIHDGDCNACHANGTTASTTCTDCHGSGTYHTGETTAHALSVGVCVASGCHGDSTGGDAATIHGGTCSRCHTGTGTPVKTCATCHGSETAALALHSGQAAAHTAASTSCTSSSCHGTSVTTIHANATPGPCVVCHDGVKTPSTVCSDCHSANLETVHAAAAASHDASSSTCISSACHSNADVAVIHDTANGGPGCVCHESGQTLTLDCATCHPGALNVVHASAGVSHTSTNITCVSDGCHAGDVTTLHENAPLGCRTCHTAGQTLTTDCATCHTGTVLSIHASADTSHTVSAGMCVTACHSTNVAEIHSAQGVACTACHASTDATVVAAFARGSTTCSDCHSGTTQEQHASAGTYHTAPASGCVLTGCHVSDVTQLHLNTGDQGCARCHATGETPTLDCTTCHSSDLITVHASADASHTAAVGSSCTGSTCHESNVAAIHNHTGGPGCVACHATGVTPSTDCSTCHSGDIVTVHQKGDAYHSVSLGGSCYTPTCHNSGNVETIHQADADVSCLACHTNAETNATTIVCSTCHAAADVPTLHASAEASHTAPTGTCVKTGCHGSNVAVLHLNGPNCAACHSAGATTTVVCTTSGCHSSDVDTNHAAAATSHVALAGYCVRSNCHSGTLPTIHDGTNGTSTGCVDCHTSGETPSGTCTDCHASTSAEVHASSDTSHTVAQSTCAGYTGSSPCHHSRVDTIHRTATNGCMSCHATGTTPSTTCSDCHVGANAPTHASAEATSHVAVSGLCVNDQCHKTDVSAIHANTTQSCLVCHGPDATATSVTCADCHTADPLTFHDQTALATDHSLPTSMTCVATGCHAGTDVTSIHSSLADGGCTVCHGAGKTATTDCTASACHGSDTAVIHTAGDASHVLPAIPPTTNCVRSGCHTGNAVAVHAAGPNCAACHATGVTPSIACTDCHASSSYTVHLPYIGTKHDTVAGACTSDNNCHSMSVSSTHNQSAGVYSTTGGPGCVVCHATGVTATVVCATCHNATTNTPTHAAAEASHTAPTGTCVNSSCHVSNVSLIHVTSDGVSHCDACHATGVTPSVDCSNTACHGSGFPSTHPAPVDKHTAAISTCTQSGCHGTNVAVIHTTQVTHTDGTSAPGCAACHNATTTPSLVCSDCHGTGVFPTGHPAPAALHAVPSTSTCVSSTCHSSANGATIHADTTLQCATCHAVGTTPSLVCMTSGCHDSTTTVISVHTTATSYHTSTTTSCVGSSCHNSDVATVHINSTKKCAVCHADGVTPSTVCSDCHANADHTASHADCNNCHAGLEHGPGPVIGTGDCLSCHDQGGSWVHPDVDNTDGCHGCQDPSNVTYYGLW
jgi:hypothetical protein